MGEVEELGFLFFFKLMHVPLTNKYIFHDATADWLNNVKWKTGATHKHKHLIHIWEATSN